MRLYKRNGWYWTDFSIDSQRYRKPLETRNWQEALRKERDMIEAAQKGELETQAGPTRLYKTVEAYLAYKALIASTRTVELEGERLSIVKKYFGDIKLRAITGQKIADYQRARHEAGIANRTINMDMGALRRVLKHCRHWRRLQDHVKNLPERPSSIGRALTQEEQKRLFEAARGKPEWEHVCCAAMVAANTSMRPVEVKHLRRQDVDLFEGTVTVRRSKNATSHRVIPLNQSARKGFAQMLEKMDSLGFTHPEHYIWHACEHGHLDPMHPIKRWDTAWKNLRKAAGLPGLRFHDLRHTIITELAEMGVPDHVMESITGHLSRRMLEHYSHIRLEAKKRVLEELDAQREKAWQESAVPTPSVPGTIQ